MKRKSLFLILWILIGSFGFVKADFISLIRADQCETIIEMYIHEDHIRIVFEIGEKDYQYFPYIIPRSYFENGVEEAEKERMLSLFFTKTFLVHVNGKLVKGELIELKRIPRNYRTSLYTGKLDTANLKISPRVVYAEIVYNLRENPDIVSFTPPLQEGYSSTFANIGFVTYHKKIPVNDLRYLGAQETVHVDWSDPWYSKFENQNIVRHHQNSLMSFLYVDPYEVRHEVLVRLKDLEYWVDLGYNIGDIIETSELDSIKQLIADFLIGRNKLYIDGIKVPPILDKVHFVEVRLSGIQILEVPKPLDYSSAIIGVIFSYSHDSIPQQVTVNWDLWNDQIQKIPCSMTDPAGPLPYDLTPGDTILVWTNYLKNYRLPTVTEVTVSQASLSLPWITLIVIIMITFHVWRKMKGRSKKWRWGLIILGMVIGSLGIVFRLNVPIPFMQKTSFTKPEAEGLIASLLKNTYRAFDFKEESVVYDKLAISNEGDLLSEVYLQTKKSMILENQGGIQVKVKSVDILDVTEVESDEDGSLAYQCQWQVTGNVGHWGHIHKRVNQYVAIVKVKPVNGVWKMYDLEILEESRKI